MPQHELKFGTKEWAEQNVNFIDGCLHDCKYCYSKEMAIRFGRRTADGWKDETVREKDLQQTFRKKQGSIMFPSAHDITPDHIHESIALLQKLLQAGNHVLIVTKPHLDCVKQICEAFHSFKKHIVFRFTIGSSDSKILKFWEPGAPDFEERFESLKFAFKKGFQTSVSCEPMLDNKTEDLIKTLYPYVTETIWVGKANFLLRRLKMNKQTDRQTMAKAHELMKFQSDDELNVLYETLNGFEKIRWKESIIKAVQL